MSTEARTANFLQDLRPMRGSRSRNGGSILVTAMPPPGHINPMLAVACPLRDQGHSIIFTTGEVFRKDVEAEGLPFVPLGGKANFDYRTFNKFILQGQTLSPGRKRCFTTLNKHGEFAEYERRLHV